MPKLNPKNFKLRAEIITPIHIDNWEVYDRLDYFVFDGLDVIQIVDRKWLIDCANLDKNLFNKIIKSIEEGNFIKLEGLKSEFYDKYFDKSYILKKISISKKVLKYLIMKDKDYSKSKNWIIWNLGEIRKFIKNKFWGIIIPWSTLKGFFRTIYFMWKKNITEAKKLEVLDKKDKIIKKIFSFIQFEDVVIKNPKLEIQWIKLATENGSIPLPVEVLIWWEIEIKISYDKNLFKDLYIDKLLKDYSFEVIWREKRILDNFEKFNTNLSDKLYSFHKEWKYPVKIWMFKKSLAYKIFWKEGLDDVYKKLIKLVNKIQYSIKEEFNLTNERRIINLVKNRIDKFDLEKFYKDNKLWIFGFKEFKNFRSFISNTIKEKFNKKKNLYVLSFEKSTKVVWQKLWIWDKSFYIDENQNPIWWISLEVV